MGLTAWLSWLGLADCPSDRCRKNLNSNIELRVGLGGGLLADPFTNPTHMSKPGRRKEMAKLLSKGFEFND